jgi:NAD(P) transhydrogenase subunit alpha
MTTQNSVTVAVPRESKPGELRVALVPHDVARLVKAGLTVKVQAGAGTAAHHTDAAYEKAGATVVADAAGLLGSADAVLKVQPPTLEEAGLIKQGALVISFLQPAADAAVVQALAARNVSVLSMNLVPRTTRAQVMDALSSQATVSGYRAALLGAQTLPKFHPMLTTAAGTIPPATVFVIGAGVAGLQAIATARRLGANVRAFDIRDAAREEVLSLGATFVASELVSKDSQDAGGYAKEQTEDKQAAIKAALTKHVAESDCLILSASVPGKKAPVLVTEEMVKGMKHGAVIVDLAAEQGGNCAITRPGETYVTDGFVTVCGPVNVASSMPTHASLLYSKNTASVLQYLVKDGAIVLNPEDEIVKAMSVKGGAQ